MPEFDFDELIDRRQVPALKHHRIVLGDDGMDLFPGGVADMDFRVAPCISDAIARRAAHDVFGYETVPEGLIAAFISWLSERHGWVVDPSEVLRSPNVLNSLAMAVSLFTEPGDRIIIQSPVFFDFEDIIIENGRRVVDSPLVLTDGCYEMDFDGLDRLAAEPSTRMIFLCNPHNPVGRVWTRAELSWLGVICRRHNLLVVSDEIHGDLTFTGHRYTPFASLSEKDAKNSVICLSPAKSFNIAACCSAFVVVPDEGRRKLFQGENSRLTVNKNNAFASVAMEAAYRGGASWLEAALDYISGNLDLVRQRLATVPGISLIEPEGTFLLWVDFRGLGLEPEALSEFLRKKAGWAITRGIAFGSQGAGFGRLNIACPRTRLSDALDGLEQAVREANEDQE
jgi:cystathionine beta-lyase